MQVLFQQQQTAVFAQGSRDWFVGFLDPHAGLVGKFIGELAVRSNRAHQFRLAAFGETFLLGDQHFMVDFAERGCLVDDAATGIRGHEIGRDKHASICAEFRLRSSHRSDRLCRGNNQTVVRSVVPAAIHL